MSIQIKVTGIKKVHKFLDVKSKLIGIHLFNGLRKATFFMQGEVKESIAGRRAEPTSVDTGRFLNSVDVSIGKKEGLVYSHVPYAKFLEWGTSKMQARKHFNNSADRNKEKVRNIIEREIRKI
jgi:HK97 gp10 family phage protein